MTSLKEDEKSDCDWGVDISLSTLNIMKGPVFFAKLLDSPDRCVKAAVK